MSEEPERFKTITVGMWFLEEEVEVCERALAHYFIFRGLEDRERQIVDKLLAKFRKVWRDF